MSDIKQSIHDQFGRAAARYKTSQVHATGEDLVRIAKLAQQHNAPSALDAGCGAGHASVAIAPYSRRVVALDLTPHMLEQVNQLAAERGFSHIETRQGDVEQIPFADSSFDLVVSRYSAHHWPHPLTALQECQRVLKPGGRFILSDIIAPEAPAHDTFLQAFELLRDASHVRDHTLAQWQAMFARSGFQPRVVFTWRLPLDFQAWTARMATPPARVAMVQHLYDTAPEEIRTAFAIQDNYDFALYGALFEAVRQPDSLKNRIRETHT